MRRDFTVGLGVIVVGLAMVVLLMPSLSTSRRSSKKRDCLNNLRQLGIYVMIYESRYNVYPGSGAQFWSDLRSTIATSEDGLFICRVFGQSRPGPGVADYRCPAPGVVLSATTPASTPIAADCTNNHWNEMNVLYFDGHVATVTPGSPAWRAVLAATAVPPGRSETPPHPPEMVLLGFYLTGWFSIYSFQAGLVLVGFGCVFWVAVRVAGRRVWS